MNFHYQGVVQISVLRSSSVSVCTHLTLKKCVAGGFVTLIYRYISGVLYDCFFTVFVDLEAVVCGCWRWLCVPPGLIGDV